MAHTAGERSRAYGGRGVRPGEALRGGLRRPRRRFLHAALDTPGLAFMLPPILGLLLVGVWLAAPWEVFATFPPVWQAAIDTGIPEVWWGRALVSVALLALAAELWAGPAFRKVAGFLVLVCWLFFSVMVWLGAPQATIAVLYPLFVLLTLWGLMQGDD